jgi:S1-C subfamily serine protease
MKRLWTFLLLLFVLSFGCASTQPNLAPAKSPEMVRKEMDSSTAALVLRHGDDVFVYCTAVWVSERTILTAHHCVEGAANQWAKDHSKKEPNKEDADDDDDDSVKLPKLMGFKMYYVVQGEVQGVSKEPTATHLATVALLDKKHDLALLKVDGNVIPPHTFAKLADEAPGVGEHVYILGHVKGLYWSHIEGVVSAVRGDLPVFSLDIHGPFLQISGPVYYGNSGGGAFNTKGELVGIASFMFRAPQTTMFIHLDAIKTFLKVK